MDTPTKNTATAPTDEAKIVSIAATVRELTRQQRDQLFDEVARGIEPVLLKKKPEDPLKAWWPQIKKKLNQGYSVRQIHAMTRSPKIGLDVSMRSLQRLITAHKNRQSGAPNGE